MCKGRVGAVHPVCWVVGGAAGFFSGQPRVSKKLEFFFFSLSGYDSSVVVPTVLFLDMELLVLLVSHYPSSSPNSFFGLLCLDSLTRKGLYYLL
jgi:hypothetical protein